jgi:hypothetical protein
MEVIKLKSLEKINVFFENKYVQTLIRILMTILLLALMNSMLSALLNMANELSMIVFNASLYENSFPKSPFNVTEIVFGSFLIVVWILISLSVVWNNIVLTFSFLKGLKGTKPN